ncbi:MAG TPA: methyltransferase [Flavilitoribacter sp.]|nr:methyltransferase [Flavilitoribacter sp.]
MTNRFSRNPVYAALMLSYLGFFLMLPNALSLCFLTLSYFSLAVKIRLEEDYLDGIHGAAFRDYRARVRRWI